ncbi:MAG: PD40 domain-containing protein [Burkholderiales bacterium]|nr:PD40 domain-containing protein [Anaerolineae bacterium]
MKWTPSFRQSLFIGAVYLLVMLIGYLPSIANFESCLIDDQSTQYPYQGRLVYSRSATLYVLDFATRQEQRFDGVRLMIDPDWSPNGELIAFGRSNIYALEPATGQITEIFRREDWSWDPSWHPDGTSLAYSFLGTGGGIYTVNVNTGEQHRLPIPQFSELGGSPYHPAWSPDGRQLAFAMPDQNGLTEIFVTDSSCAESENTSCELQQLTDADGQTYSPAWSPDGSQIAFTSSRVDTWGVYIMNADGTNQHQITQNPYGAFAGDFAPTWSPDGEFIAFARRGNTSGVTGTNIYIMRPDGTELTCITREGGMEPDWAVGETSSYS